MHPETIAAMGGGDFDGDTIQLLFDDLAKAAGAAQDSFVRSASALPTAGSQRKPSVARNTVATPKDYAALVHRSIIAPLNLGPIERAQQIIMDMEKINGQLSPEMTQAAIDLADAYDVDTTFIKTGQVAQWTKMMNLARRGGTSFNHAFKDSFGALSSGQYDQMNAWADVNFASLYNPLTASRMGAARSMPYSSALQQILLQQNQLQFSDLGNRSVKDLLNSDESSLRALGEYYEYRNRLFGEQLLTGAAISTPDEDK